MCNNNIIIEESLNSYLNSIFPTKPSYYELNIFNNIYIFI